MDLDQWNDRTAPAREAIQEWIEVRGDWAGPFFCTDPSPLKAQEVTLAVDVVLDGGTSEFGTESTVLDATGETPVFLREGATSRSEIERFLGISL